MKCRILAGLVLAVFAVFALPAAAQPGGKLVIGQSAPLTGPAADIGRDIRDGAIAYFKKVNRAGGVNGREIELVTIDDANDRKRAGANAKKLLDENKAVALFGFASATLSMDAIPHAEAAGSAHFAPFTGSLAIRDKKPVFTVRASYEDEIKRIVEHWANFGANRMVVLHYDDEVGRVNFDTVSRLLKAQGATPLQASIKRGAKVDPKTFADIFKFDPQVIVVTTQSPPVLELIKAMNAANKSYPISALSFVNPDELASAPGGVAKGTTVMQVVPNPRSLTVPVVKECGDAMKEINGTLNYTTLEACIAAKVLVEAIRRTGKAPTRQGIHASLQKLGKYDTGGFVVAFAPDDQHGSSWTDFSILSRAGAYRH
jgi:branched-chain amino acid transport system substrate-binding protein